MLYFVKNIHSICFLFRKSLFDAHVEDPDYHPLPEERPGGFEWGENRNQAQNNQ